MVKHFFSPLFIIVILGLTGCASANTAGSNETVSTIASATETGSLSDSPSNMGMGPGSGMMARHHAQIPGEYAGLANPVPTDENSLARGAAIYEQHCTSCHGDGGMGDGPAGQQLDPVPAAIAHTNRMLGDDYLFWRISEGGSHDPFSSAMPRWQDVLKDTDRWDVINFVRTLGSGQIVPGRGPATGETFDPAVEAERHAQMAADGVAQGVLSQAEADTFISVHAELDRLMATEMSEMSGGMESMQQEMLEQLAAEGIITQFEAGAFSQAHDKLLAAGLMQ